MSDSMRQPGVLQCRPWVIDEIKQVKYRYLRALDTKHWDEFADTLTEDVTGDYGASLGAELHFTDRDALVQFMRTSLGPEIITEPRVDHPEIVLDGDEAYDQRTALVANWRLRSVRCYLDAVCDR